MNALPQLMSRIAYPLQRVTLGIVLIWIGALHFVDPSPVVGLISLTPFALLASNGFVYMLGTGEVLVGLLLFANFQAKYVGIASMLLFVGTLAIFATTPKVVYGDAGFPLLQLPGEFLLKDLVLFAAGASISAMAQAQEMTRMGMSEQRHMHA